MIPITIADDFDEIPAEIAESDRQLQRLVRINY